MIKNRTAQLIFQTIYVTLGFVGLVASLGIFDNVSVAWMSQAAPLLSV